MAATAASAGHLHLSPLLPLEEPTVASTTPPTSIADDGHLPLAADVAEEAKASPSTTARTHHGRAIITPIQAIHHDGDDEHILDPSRPQADVDHRGHTRRVILARHQQLQLHPAPISPSGHPFFQNPHSSFPRPRPSSARPGLDDPGRSSCHTADPRSTTQPAQPTCCRTSITPPPVVTTPTSICQHAYELARCHDHRLARANCRRRCPRTATVSARCPHPPPSSMPSVASDNGPDQAAAKHRPPNATCM
ncbi:hypothetical protein ACLOJK_026968 [Asimina triloba]